MAGHSTPGCFQDEVCKLAARSTHALIDLAVAQDARQQGAKSCPRSLLPRDALQMRYETEQQPSQIPQYCQHDCIAWSPDAWLTAAELRKRVNNDPSVARDAAVPIHNRVLPTTASNAWTPARYMYHLACPTENCCLLGGMIIELEGYH